MDLAGRNNRERGGLGSGRENAFVLGSRGGCPATLPLLGVVLGCAGCSEGKPGAGLGSASCQLNKTGEGMKETTQLQRLCAELGSSLPHSKASEERMGRGHSAGTHLSWLCPGMPRASSLPAAAGVAGEEPVGQQHPTVQPCGQQGERRALSPCQES